MNNKVSSKILTKGFRLLEELQPPQPESSFQNTFCKLNEFLLLFQQIPLVLEKLHINIKYPSLLSCCAPSSSSSPSPPPPPTPPPSLWPGWRCTWGLSWQPRSSQKEGLSASWTEHKTGVQAICLVPSSTTDSLTWGKVVIISTATEDIMMATVDLQQSGNRSKFIYFSQLEA